MGILCHDILSRILAERGSCRETYSGIEEVYKLSVSEAEEKRGGEVLCDNSSPMTSMPREYTECGSLEKFRLRTLTSAFWITLQFDIPL